MQMDEKILISAIGIVFGALGYWIANFWMKPILQYRELRAKVYADFIFYAQVINSEDLNQQMKDLYLQRVTANRRNSADLAACINDLPSWYIWGLTIRGIAPKNAITLLIRYSNTTDFEQAHRTMKAIEKALDFSNDIL